MVSDAVELLDDLRGYVCMVIQESWRAIFSINELVSPYYNQRTLLLRKRLSPVANYPLPKFTSAIMTRSTTRALAMLLLGGSISSGVLSAPTSISSRSMSSSPILNGAQTPEIPTSCARLPGSRSRSGPNPHRRRGVHANIVPQRVLDGDDLATKTSERNVNEDATVSLSVLEGRAAHGSEPDDWDVVGSESALDDSDSSHCDYDSDSEAEWELVSSWVHSRKKGKLSQDPKKRYKQFVQTFMDIKKILESVPVERTDAKGLEEYSNFLRHYLIPFPLVTDKVRTEAEEILGKLNAEMEERRERKERTQEKGRMEKRGQSLEE
ncbi:hypothetical protein C8R42DRAFT_660628 [Lentinula raphanica]|nr:hypothetical protein C8R42DRAFT_660628 [Lentinula raphanica]